MTDSGFSALEFLAALLRHEITCVARLRLDAALHQPAPRSGPGTLARPRTKGERLPPLAEVLTNKATRWQRVTVPGWYGEGDRIVEVCSDAAAWRHAGLPVVPIRWVLPRDPCRRFDPRALLCTDPAQEPLQIVRWFVQRWRTEVVFPQMAKADVLALGSGGQGVTDLDVGIGDDHAVDQEQHELAALLEAGLVQAAPHALSERLQRRRQAGKLPLALGVAA